MAYEYVNIASPAGSRLSAIWDGIVVNNSKWSVYDASAGTNKKVYRCNDSGNNVDYYVSVDDNQADFSTMELWEGWDASAHIGTGDEVTSPDSTNTIRFYGVRGTHVVYNDHRVIIATAYNYLAHYVGQPKRFDTTKNMPFIIGRSSGNTSTWYNPLGYQNTNTTVFQRTLWNHSASVDQEIRAQNYNSTFNYTRTSSGQQVFEETPFYDVGTNVLLGYLDGVKHVYSSAQGRWKGEEVEAEDGRWLYQTGNYSTWTGCWIRLA